MSVAKVTEITAGSPESFEHAVSIGLTRAGKTLKGIQGAWIKEQKVVWDGSAISEFRVTLKVTFILQD
jgi:dodecin